jgi:hypothetical protein
VGAFPVVRLPVVRLSGSSDALVAIVEFSNYQAEQPGRSGIVVSLAVADDRVSDSQAAAAGEDSPIANERKP